VAEEMQIPRPAGEEHLSGGFPVWTGLSVAVGYLVGGVILLFPYFFGADVGAGLLWSFSVCIVALIGFGFGKEFVLSESGSGAPDKSRTPWSKIRSSVWEGLQMVVLGGIAALAACVRLFNGVL
jgi:VIT1/CCC1 family predicted Fe2+/Mn2+ transporter